MRMKVVEPPGGCHGTNCACQPNMEKLLRHRQTKGLVNKETHLKPPRQISALPDYNLSVSFPLNYRLGRFITNFKLIPFPTVSIIHQVYQA
jgi:hypothetical protein